MPRVFVQDVEVGSTLSVDVVSSLGGVLLEKGTRLTTRHLEVLEAFLIEEVEVEEDQPKDKLKAKPKSMVGNQKPVEPPLPPPVPKPAAQAIVTFEQEFLRAVQFFKEMYHQVSGGLPIPVKELRECLARLIQFPSDVKNIMTCLKQNYTIDEYTFYHSVSVGFIAVSIGRWRRLPEMEMMAIALAGTLHDIGKSKVNPNIIYKTTQLTSEELQELRKYPVYGYHLVKGNSAVSEAIALGVLGHQERENGTGYPLKLQGNAIHLYAKMIAVADIFHAMSSTKSYKKGSSPYVVLEQLLSDSFGKLDPAIVRTFVDGMTQFSLGTKVELQDGSEGKIVYVDPSQPTRPMVDVRGKIIHLGMNRSFYIQRVLLD